MIAKNSPQGSASMVAGTTRAGSRAKNAKEKAEKESLIVSERKKVDQLQKTLNSERRKLFWINPHLPDRSKPLSMSTWDMIWLASALLFGCFLLFMEQGAVATVLVDLGVFGIRNMWEARCFLCSVVAAGFVLGAVTGKLPLVLRAILTSTLVFVLVVSLAGLIPSIAANVGIAAGIANQQVDFGNIDDAEQIEKVSDSSEESPLWSWIMCSCSLTSICLTTWLMELYREQVIYEATPKVDNDEYISCDNRIAELETKINKSNSMIADFDGRIAEIRAEEDLEVKQAMEEYRRSL
jgi:hypothetical protein